MYSFQITAETAKNTTKIAESFIQEEFVNESLKKIEEMIRFKTSCGGYRINIALPLIKSGVNVSKQIYLIEQILKNQGFKVKETQGIAEHYSFDVSWEEEDDSKSN